MLHAGNDPPIGDRELLDDELLGPPGVSQERDDVVTTGLRFDRTEIRLRHGCRTIAALADELSIDRGRFYPAGAADARFAFAAWMASHTFALVTGMSMFVIP
jgi:hypothetical protein